MILEVLLWCSGLRIWYCYCSGSGCSCGKAWELPHASSAAKKKKKIVFYKHIVTMGDVQCCVLECMGTGLRQ